MKSISSFTAGLAGLALATAALCGCQTTPPAQAAGPGSATTPVNGGAMSQADMTKMCSGMHEKMMGAKTPEERRALMHQHMQSMPPEMHQQMHQQMHQHGKSLSPEMRQQMHERMETMCQ